MGFVNEDVHMIKNNECKVQEYSAHIATDGSIELDYMNGIS